MSRSRPARDWFVLLSAAILLSVVRTGTLLSQQSAEQQVLAARDSIWRFSFSRDTTQLRRFFSQEPPSSMALLDRSTPFSAALNGSPVYAFDQTRVVRGGRGVLLSAEVRVITGASARRDTTTGFVQELYVIEGSRWVSAYWRFMPDPSSRSATLEIVLGDTLGADFPLADSATATGQSTDYDPLIGTWEYRFQSRRPDGSFGPAGFGHWTFEKKPGEGLIEDRFRPDEPARLMGSSLYTYRTYDPARHLWQIMGTSSYGGAATQSGLGWSQGPHRFLFQRSTRTWNRFRYTLLDDNHFVWRTDRSFDGGVTWIRDFGVMEAWRIGR